MKPWVRRRELEVLRKELRELSRVRTSLLVDVESLREEIRTQGERQSEQLKNLIEVIKPRPQKRRASALFRRAGWREGLRILWRRRSKLPGWVEHLLVDHWQWILGVIGAAIAFGIPATLQFEANNLQKDANVVSREALDKLSKQIEMQEESNTVLRRVQLLNTIYESSECDLEDLREQRDRAVESARLKLSSTPRDATKRAIVERELALVEARPIDRCPPRASPRMRQEAVLALVKIEGEDLSLRGANLYELNLAGDTNLSNVDLSGANLSGANLSRSQLSEATLEDISLIGADLSRADLTAAKLTDSDASNSDFDGSELPGADLSRTNLARTDIGWANLERATLIDSSLFESSLIESNLSGAKLTRAELSGANLIGAVLKEAILADGVIFYARLDGADLEEADLSRAFLRGASLIGASLENANLEGANLLWTDLDGTKIFGADLSRSVDLDQAQLDQTCGDSSTRIPDDLLRPLHWLDRRHRSDDAPAAGCPKDENQTR